MWTDTTRAPECPPSFDVDDVVFGDLLPLLRAARWVAAMSDAAWGRA